MPSSLLYGEERRIQMRAIKILDTHTINKIAAGEVVERPCSVVKELVENSIDAKASSITVEIKNGGVDLIRVTDNGVGIPKDQVEVAFLRHATSKITSAEDLYEVMSLGFRGEALASIAAVSNVELLTKEEQELTGKRIEISGGKMSAAEEVACPNGTTFIMRHLFFNVPARKAFLSSSSSEGAKISDYMYKLALAHPEVSFKYIQNGKTIFTTSGDHELKHAILNIYGKEYARNTLECYYKSDTIECMGLIGKPVLNRGNRNYEHFFINGRYIKSQLLQGAVEDAYKTLVMVGKFPFSVLHLYLDPSLVDVNVHPTKLQVRFKNPDTIYKAVYEGVSHALREAYLVPQVATEPGPKEAKVEPVIEQGIIDTFFAPRKEKEEVTPQSLLKHNPTDFQREDVNPPSISRLFGNRDSHHVSPQAIDTYEKQLSQVFKEEMIHQSTTEPTDEMIHELEKPNKEYGISRFEDVPLPPKIQVEEKPTSPAILPTDYRIVGQVFKTYWLIEYHEKVFIIDQHAAHERVLYEQFMAEFKANEVATQLLLMPETLMVTPVEMTLLNEHEELFKKLGFQFEAFGENAVAIREVPFILNEPLSPAVFKEVLDRLTHDKLQDIAELKAEAIIRMSCRSAIKAHDQISDRECRKLIELLLALDNPFTCPHGRPTLVALTQVDIEKMFKRI